MQISCQTNPNTTDNTELLSAHSVIVHHWQHVFSSKDIIELHSLHHLQNFSACTAVSQEPCFQLWIVFLKARAERCLPRSHASPGHPQGCASALSLPGLTTVNQHGIPPRGKVQRQERGNGLRSQFSSALIEEEHLSTAVWKRMMDICRWLNFQSITYVY